MQLAHNILLHILIITALFLAPCQGLRCSCTTDQNNCNKSTLECEIENGFCRTSFHDSGGYTQRCDNSICSTIDIFPYPGVFCCQTDLCNIYTTTTTITTQISNSTLKTITNNIVTSNTSATTNTNNTSSTQISDFPNELLSPAVIIPIIGSVVLLVIILAIIILFTLCCLYFRMTSTKNNTYIPHKDMLISPPPPGECESLSFLSSGRLSDSGSGSSVGAVHLTNTTIANQVTKEKTIGYGRYGEVWKGNWKGRNVAIKIFSSLEADSWKTEVEIYHTCMIRHEYLLGFIAADIFSNYGIEYWLITDYMENGSLHEYLTENELNVSDVIKLALSATSGVAHLHTEIIGRREYTSKNCNEASKPAIAHRDIKSRNILINKQLECVLADFGLAVRHNSEEDKVIMMSNNRTGTSRYMAPEILGETMDKTYFEAYRRADMYALGLVLWEICCRCKIDDNIEACEYPYYEHVDRDPSLEEMREIVVVNNERPQIPMYWSDVHELRILAQIMTECWYTDASARLPALRAKKSIAAIANNST